MTRSCLPPPRPFGLSAADLAIDFVRTPRPWLVTEVLAACHPGADPAMWWDATVGRRTAALLGLMDGAASGGAEHAEGGQAPPPTLVLTAPCPHCADRFEVALPISALLALEGAQDTALDVGLPDGRTLRLRRPTGADLRAWCEDGALDPARLLGALIVDGQAQPGDAPVLFQALADADPLVDFEAACRCPACGREADCAVDLEAHVLAWLAAGQRRLLREVHTLASRYGWREDEILAVPPARRARYLAMIEGTA